MARERSLAMVRREIDRLDERLLHLVNARAMLALEVGHIKKREKWPVFDATREAFVLRHVMRRNRGPLSPRAIQHIFQAILSECRRRERTTRNRGQPPISSRGRARRKSVAVPN